VLHFFFGDSQLPPQQCVLLIGDLVEKAGGNEQRRIPSRGLRVQLPQLQLDAFTDRTRAYTCRIHRLHVRQHALDLGGRCDDLRLQIARDLIERFNDVAVVVDGIDDCGAHAHVALRQARHLQLPGQMLLQRFAAGGGKILRVVLARPRCFRRAGDRRVAPVLLFGEIEIGFALGALAVAAGGSLGGLRGRRGGFELRGFELGGFQARGLILGLEHHVALERLADLCLEFEDRQLQQADGLLQLRGHRELLAKFELQGWLEHSSRNFGSLKGAATSRHALPKYLSKN
jgi:hypothetical protein